MLIEDDMNHYELISRSMKKLEGGRLIRTIHLADGESAQRYLASPMSELPRLILLDLKIPKIDGHELLAWMKSHEELSRIPVVILTTSLSDADLTHSISLHANSVLTKSMSFAEFSEMLTDTVNYWMRWNRAS
jgi:CheY-like chemotaxis protein